MSVGNSTLPTDARAKVDGTLPYGTNLQLPEMLIARVLRSPYPHAGIVRVDASAAAQMPGVVAVLTAADLGQPGGPGRLSGAMKKDQPVLAFDRVRYIGEPVAVVAAENAEIAESALEFIEVEYQELPGVYDAYEAMQAGAPTLHEASPGNVLIHAKLRHGNIESGFAEADEIIEETYTSPVAQHAALEPHVTAAQWQEGRLTVWSATQAPHTVRRVLAELFSLEQEAVRVIVPPLGGGYGGKGHVRLQPLVSALAWKVGGRPVKLVNSRAEEFVTVTKHAARLVIKSGFRRDGALTARQVTIYWNVGAYADASPALVGSGMVRAVGPYRIPNVRVDSYGLYTNLPPAGAFRGAMASQCTWAYESHTDAIARSLGRDPLAYRLDHLLTEGDEFATGEHLHDVHFAECLSAAAENLGWTEPRSQSESGPLRRGRGLAVMMKSTIATSKSQCRLAIDDTGSATLSTSTVEMGQGAHTALAQIAAESLTVGFDSVSVVGPDTDRSPFDSTTSASRATNMMGTAVLNGAEELKKKLIDAAAPLLEYAPEELGIGDGHVFVAAQPDQRIPFGEIVGRHNLEAIEALGEYQTKGGLDPETGQGLATPHWHQGACACEVEVDTETGKVTIIRFSGSSYAGRVVNPTLARLQNEGNIIFGLGPTMMEEVIADGGQIINSNLSDYLIPSFLDVPPELITSAIESEGGEFHGIGEMTLPPVAPAVANAIYDAVGVQLFDLPLTPERVLKALSDERKR